MTDAQFRKLLQRLLVLTVAAIISMASVSPVSAKVGEWTGDDLLKYCVSNDPNNSPKTRDENDLIVYCYGYVEGTIVSALIFDGKLFCLPKGLTPADMLMTTVNFFLAHPEQKRYTAASSMFAAARERWPCPR